ncbi:SPOR domain-containing protein [Rhodoblastus sp.]|uniref:SPOR domain-containing protein n=1 Tax=Rhodoblastus sp. TaxID=1962975 RepID=UPI003F983DAD
MGEFAAKFRPEVDLDEFERRLRAAAPMPQQRPEESSDPLAELARLVNNEALAGRKDPFEALFRAQSAVAEGREAAQARLRDEHPDFAPFGLREPYFAHPPHHEIHAADETFHGDYAQIAQGDYAKGDEALGYPSEAYAADPLPYQESEPAWAEAPQQDARDEQAWPTAFGEAAPAESAPRIRRKVMYGMAAVMAVGVLGVAGLLTMRHRSANHEVVTIQPDSAPARVAPAQVESAAAPEGQGLFDRKNGSGVAKVVASAEQPADLKATLNNAQKTDGAAAGAASVATPTPPTPADQASQPESLFPPARKVKTVAVRADGSVIGGAAAPAPGPVVNSALPSMAAANMPPEAPAMPESPPAGKSTQRAAALTAPAPKAPARVRPRQAPKAEVAEETAAGGGYAVQLAGEPSEADARLAAKRLSAKYSGALEGRHAVPVKAAVGARTVWRVRVGHLSEARAKSMCAAVKSAGGSCFIAKD